MLSVPGCTGWLMKVSTLWKPLAVFAGPGPAAAAFDVPLEVEVRPVKAGDQWIDHRGVLPGRQELARVDAGEALRRRARRCVRCRASGRNPAGPTAGSAASACRSRAAAASLRIARQELAAPHPHVRAEVVALRFLVRNVLHELAHEVRRGPAIHQRVVVAQRPERLEVAERLEIAAVEGLRGRRERVRLRVLEAEDEVHVGLRDDRLEGRRDVLRARSRAGGG